MLQKLDDSATNSRHYRLLNIHQKLDDLGIISRDYFIGLFGSLMEGSAAHSTPDWKQSLQVEAAAQGRKVPVESSRAR
jgi:hypothetical protein